MPCRTDDFQYNNYSASSVTTTKYNQLKTEADNVTRLLCSVMSKLEKTQDPAFTSLKTIDGLTKWWEQHKEVDRKRIEKEVEDAKRAINGLSEEAVQLLIQQLSQKK